MRVALVANTAWLDEELSQFKYLVVGLIDEQAQVVQVLPEGVPVEDVSPFGSQVSWRDSRLSALRNLSLRRLADALAELEVDLIHALDGRLWQGCAALGKTLSLPVVLSANSVLDVESAARLKGPAAAGRYAWTAATEPIGQAIAERLGDETTVQVIRPGVHAVAEEDDTTDHEADEPLCAVVSGSGEPDMEYQALFEALRAVAQSHPQTQFFMDTQEDPHRLWRLAEREGLLANVSMAPRRLGHRELLLRAQLLIQPQPLGRSRGLTLGALARGIPVIARTDPWVDYLVESQTAWLVEQPDARQWEQLVRRCIEHRDLARDLGRSARRWVVQHHSVAHQVEATLGLYRRLTAEAIKFPG